MSRAARRVLALGLTSLTLVALDLALQRGRPFNR